MGEKEVNEGRAKAISLLSRGKLVDKCYWSNIRNVRVGFVDGNWCGNLSVPNNWINYIETLHASEFSYERAFSRIPGISSSNRSVLGRRMQKGFGSPSFIISEKFPRRIDRAPLKRGSFVTADRYLGRNNRKGTQPNSTLHSEMTGPEKVLFLLWNSSETHFELDERKTKARTARKVCSFVRVGEGWRH